MKTVETVKETEVVAALMRGVSIAVGTVHCCVLTALDVRDKKTAAVRGAHIEKTTILTDSDAAIVENWLPDSEDASKWVQPVKPGQRICVWPVTKSDNRGGIRHLSGEIKLVNAK